MHNLIHVRRINQAIVLSLIITAIAPAFADSDLPTDTIWLYNSTSDNQSFNSILGAMTEPDLSGPARPKIDSALLG